MALTVMILALVGFKTVWQKNDVRHDMCLILVATLLVGYHRVYDAVLLLFLVPMIMKVWTAGYTRTGIILALALSGFFHSDPDLFIPLNMRYTSAIVRNFLVPFHVWLLLLLFLCLLRLPLALDDQEKLDPLVA
jgi:hypothetical protein